MKNLIPNFPSQITESVDYGEHSIVSKIILNSDNLQITLFAVDKGESFSEHTSTKELIIHILEGECEFYLEDKRVECKEGDYFHMPKNMKHAINSTNRFKFLLYQF